MAKAAGMVIPKATSTGVQELKNIDLTSSTIEVMLETFFKFSKKDQERMTKQLESVMEYNKQISDYTKPDPKQEAIKKKLNKYYQKWFLQNDFLKKIGGFFKKLIDRAGGWLIDLLRMLFFLAIFDPEGKFLTSIMNFLIGILETVLRTIINWLPVIAKRMWRLFWDVLVPGFGRLGKMIGDTLFGTDSAMSGLFEDIGKLIPKLVVFGGGISFLKPIIKALAGLVSFIIANPIAAAIIAVIVAIALIFIYSDQIAEFFEVTIPKWFNSLGNTMKSVVAFIIIITSPLWGLFYGLAKLFQSFKKIGVAATFQLIGDAIYNFFADIGNGISNWVGEVVDQFLDHLFGIGNLFKTFGIWIYKGFIKIKNKISNWISSVGKFFAGLPRRFGSWLAGIKQEFLTWWKNFSFKELVANMIDSVFGKGTSSRIGKVMDTISGLVADMTAYLSAFFSDPTAYLQPFGNQARRDAAFTGAKVAQAYASGDEKLIQAAQTSGVSNEVLKRGDTSEIAKLLLKQNKEDEKKLAAIRKNVTTNIQTAKDFRTDQERKAGT